MTGTVLAFIFIGVTVPVATIGAIWLEQRMPPLPQMRIRPAPHAAQPPRDPLSPGGRHHR